MASMEVRSDTISFLKFNDKNEWGKDSMINSPFVWRNLATKDDIKYTNLYDVTPDHIGSSTNDVSGGLSGKYKSRTKGKVLKEYSCIFTDLPNTSYESMTVEFWVYIKSESGNPSDSGYLAGYSSSNFYDNEISPTGSALFEFGNHGTLPGPVVYNAGSINSTYSIQDYHWTISNTNTFKSWGWPILIYLSYSASHKTFVMKSPNTFQNIVVENGVTGGRISRGFYYYYGTFGQYPPNHWYHIAVVINSGYFTIFINGKQWRKSTITNPSGNTSGISYQNKKFFKQTSDYHFSIGNRMSPSYTCALERSSDSDANNPRSKNNMYVPWPYWNLSDSENLFSHKNYHTMIVDDVRISDNAIYTENFIPPGFPGYQLLNINDKIYGYDSTTYQFTLIADNWSTRTVAEKKTIINSIACTDLSLEDIQSVIQAGDNPTIEVYDFDAGRHKCELPNKEYETTIIPSSLLTTGAPEAELTNIDFSSYSISGNSYIKTLITTDLSTYKTYDFENNQWVNCSINDISTQGIPIDKIKNIPSSDTRGLGNKVAFAYLLHLEPYESDCSIEKLDIEVSLIYGWNHCNKNVAEYEYPMLSKFKVKFYEDGEFKVNYMDKP